MIIYFQSKLQNSWKAQAFFKKIDARANLPEYKKGLACKKSKALIIGGGPCGLRTAIELQLLGAKVVSKQKLIEILKLTACCIMLFSTYNTVFFFKNFYNTHEIIKFAL